jgi:hypothetical protein
MNQPHDMQPQGLTTLQPGSYTLSIQGPSGLVLNLTMDIAKRGVMAGQFDDELLREILAVQSIADGWLMPEIKKAYPNFKP